MTGISIMGEGVAALATAAAVLIEDAHPELLSASARLEDQAALLQALGADLSALGVAAAVLARRDGASRSCNEVQD